MKYNWLFSLTVIGILIHIPLYTNQSCFQAHKEMHSEQEKQVWITVFVHGIKSVKNYLTPNNWFHLWCDTVQDTFYSECISCLRSDPFFYQHQPLQALGLQPVSCQVAPGSASGAIACLYDQVDKLNNPHPIENHFYTFGWDALLSHKSRYASAHELYHSLIELRNTFRKKGIEPHIRLIGYSHGGNVVTNIGAVYEHEKVDRSLSIDELIILGMPLHKNTAHYIMSPVFKQIYNIYSMGDRVQPIDIFSSGRILSPRLFYNTKRRKLKNNLHQIELHVVKKADDCKRPYQPDTNAFYYDRHCKSYLLRDVSPGHIELWFFGWTPLNYRKSYPFYPLPTVVLLPYVLNEIKKVQDEYRPTRPILATIDPRNKKMIIKDKRNYGPSYVKEFIDYKTMDELKAKAWSYEPKDFTVQTFESQVQKAHQDTVITRKRARINPHQPEI